MVPPDCKPPASPVKVGELEAAQLAFAKGVDGDQRGGEPGQGWVPG